MENISFGDGVSGRVSLLMAKFTTEQTHVALQGDLKKLGSGGFVEVLNDSLRKTFTARTDGAIFEFGHNQTDAAYWNGVKYYGSGSRAKVRFRRTQDAVS